MEKLNHSKRMFWIANALVFLFIWLCNTLTMICVDDYNYHFSFATWDRIHSILDIFPSMAAHYDHTNGRVVAHFFVQVFEFLPKPVFNVVNTLVFLLQLYLVYRLAAGKKNYNTLLYLGIFAAVWVFSPGFGEANLWLDGACNYLWSILAGFLFFGPYVRWYREGTFLRGWKLILFFVLSLLFGAYSENASAAFLFMSACLLLIGKVLEKKKLRLGLILPFLFAAAGYVFMIVAPGERANKGVSMSLAFLRQNFVSCVEMLKNWWILLAVLFVGFTLCVMLKKDRKKLLFVGVLFLGALVSSFIFMAAAYYPIRAASCSTVLLTAADAILLCELLPKRGELVNSLLAVMILCASYWCVIGLNDIYVVHWHMKANETHIIECRDRGEMDVEISAVHPQTKYSTIYELRYIHCDDAEEWPNNSMARFYGVDSILGVN